MHSFVFLAFAAMASATKLLEARAESFDLFSRQTTIACSGSAPADSPNPCEVVCGAGSRQCVFASRCFRPQLGETCCSSGYACPAGSRCIQGGCCREGECDGVTFVSTLPGDGYTVTSATSASTSFVSSSSSATSISSVVPPSYAPVPVLPSPSSSVNVPPAVYTPPANGTGGNATTPTWYPPAQQTTNGGLRGEVAGWMFSGLALLGVGFVV